MMAALREGADLGEYRLGQRLAIGGMAEVWEARRRGEVGGRRFAVKVLLEMFARDPKLCAMFRDEAAIAQRLDHPNIVRVEALIEEGGLLAQVMELFDGRDLRRVLQAVVKAEATVPIAQAAYVARQVARGLAHAHALTGADGRSLELVHRDVSPHNIMVGRRGRVAVLDFGVARARERVTQTTVGTVKGKLAYMAPEQMLAGDVTPRADIWALGVVLWECLALRRAFAGVADADLVHAVTRADLPRVDVHRPDAPPALTALVAHMTRRDPHDRPADMGAVEAALDEVLAELGEASSARAMDAWAAGYLAASARKTGVIAAPQLTVPARPPTMVSGFDDSARDVDDLADTAPPDEGVPTVATPMVNRTDGVAVADLTDPVEVPPRARGHDLLPGAGPLELRDQVAPTLAHGIAVSSDEAPTVMPGAGLEARARALAVAATPVTPLASPIVRTAPSVTPGSVTKPLVAPPAPPRTTTLVPSVSTAQPPPRRSTVLWIVGGLALGVGLTALLARACA